MKTYEGLAVYESWEEGQCIIPMDGSDTTSLAVLIREDGGSTIGFWEDGVFASRYPDTPRDVKYREEYTESTGNRVPPVMRLRVTVEVETLSQEESEAAWNALREKRRQEDDE